MEGGGDKPARFINFIVGVISWMECTDCVFLMLSVRTSQYKREPNFISSIMLMILFLYHMFRTSVVSSRPASGCTGLPGSSWSGMLTLSFSLLHARQACNSHRPGPRFFLCAKVSRWPACVMIVPGLKIKTN